MNTKIWISYNFHKSWNSRLLIFFKPFKKCKNHSLITALQTQRQWSGFSLAAMVCESVILSEMGCIGAVQRTSTLPFHCPYSWAARQDPSIDLPESPFLLSKMKIIGGSWWGLNEVMYGDRSSGRIQNDWDQEGFECSIHDSSHFSPLANCLSTCLFVSLSFYLICPCTTFSNEAWEWICSWQGENQPLPRGLEPSQPHPCPLDVGVWGGPWRARYQLLLNIRERLMKPQLIHQAGCHLPGKASY